MKDILFVSILLFQLACAGEIENSTVRSIESKGKVIVADEPTLGLAIINIKKVSESHLDTISLKVSGKEMLFYSNMLITNDSIYNIFETSNSTWGHILNCKAFDPEMNIFYINASKTKEGVETLFINGEVTEYSGKSEYISFVPYKKFLKSSLVGISKENPLLTKPFINAKSIDVPYLDYYFEVIEFKGDWVKLKSDKESSGKEVIGWSRWKDKSDMILEIIYNI